MASNDPAAPNVILKLVGQQKFYVEAAPPALNFGLVFEGAPAPEQRVRITSHGEKPLSLRLPEEPPRKSVVYTLSTVTPGREWELVVRLDPSAPAGPLNELLSLATGVEKQPLLEIRSSGTVATRLEVEPSTLDLSSAPADQPFSAEVRIRNRSEQPVKVLTAASDVKGLAVALSAEQPGRTYRVKVEAPPKLVLPAAGARVLLRTDDPHRPEVSFTVIRSRPAAPPPSPSGLVGQAAPPFSLKTTAGREVSNSAARNRVTLLDFFAANCGYCKRQIPRLQALLRAEFKGKPVRLVLVAQRMGQQEFGADQIREVLRQAWADPGGTELAVEMTNATGGSFHVSSYPTLMILGRSGKVEAADIGLLADLETRVKGQVAALLAGKPVPQGG